jgi:hypothetical protein
VLSVSPVLSRMPIHPGFADSLTIPATYKRQTLRNIEAFGRLKAPDAKKHGIIFSLQEGNEND